MFTILQSVANHAASTASDGVVTEMRLDTAPSGKGDIALTAIYPRTLPKSQRPSPLVIANAAAEAGRVLPFVERIDVVGPFANVWLKTDTLFKQAFVGIARENIRVAKPERIMVEYLSPNTNKPLHLGHVRNGVLGSTVANLLSAVGHTVVRSILVNDRGEHICK